MVEKILKCTYCGGIYDHLGFGFARYSTDRQWLVSHFEKMLYDNALLALVYLETFQITKNTFLCRRRQGYFYLRATGYDFPRGGLLLRWGRLFRGGGGEILSLVAPRG